MPAATLRTFVALEWDAAARRDLAALQERLKTAHLPLRWVAPQNIHLTLAFLGDVERIALPAIATALAGAAADSAPMRLQARGVGVFPGLQRARVLWAGVDGAPDALQRLYAGVQRVLAPCGHRPDTRPFRAHATLARARGRVPPGELTAALRQVRDFTASPATISEMVLMRSRLTPGGAVHQLLARVPLGTATPTFTGNG